MILASKSPRRKEILENFGLKLKIKTKEVEETSSKENYIEIIREIAHKKGIEIAMENPSEIVVSADTLVVLDGEIMGKPIDEKDAKDMLKKLSGRSHEVVTAFAVFLYDKKIEIINHCITKVFFKNLSEEEIDWYIKSGEPMDKAGAYGIQGFGNVFVERIEGDFFNVMGFPLSCFYDTLNRAGLNLIDML
jgi:septum formation protein